jgi:hypothetical protein
MAHKHNLSCLDNCPSPGRKAKKTSAPTTTPSLTGQEAIDRIRLLIDDEEIHIDDNRIRRHYAATMSTPQIGSFIHELDRQLHAEKKRRTTSEHEERWRQNLVWRLNTTIRGLREALVDRREEQKRTRLAEGARAAEATGRETCTCGQRHPYGANFYVSVQDAGRTGLLRGPFKTHAQAIAAIPQAKKEAEAANSRAIFYAFGTVAMPHSYRKPGILDTDKKRKAA